MVARAPGVRGGRRKHDRRLRRLQRREGRVRRTLGLNELIERNLIYVAPLLFVGTAFVLERRRTRTSAVVVATAFVLYLVTATPYHIDIPVFFDAPGLAILPGLDRAVGLSDAGATVLLVVLALASAALVLFVRGTRSTAGPVVAAAAAVFVLAWNFYGEVSFARSAHKEADRNLRTMPRPLDWVDRSVPGDTQVYYLGQGIDDTGDIVQLEFWNRKVQHVWSFDGTAPGPGPTVVPEVVAPDGRLEPSQGVQYMVADEGISPVGHVIARKIHRGGRGARLWRLVRDRAAAARQPDRRGDLPRRVGQAEHGAEPVLRPGNGRSIVKVHVSRTEAAARYPATVVVSVGKLVLTGDPGARRPALAVVNFTRRWRVRNNLNHTFVFEAPPPPFRVQTSVTPFPHSRDPRIGDPRDLGANISYTVTVIAARASRGACARSGGCRASARAFGA